jgi:hypothetical protein
LKCPAKARSHGTGEDADPERPADGRDFGTASIKEVVKGDSLFEWHLTDVERAKRFRKPKGHPQPVWFTPF